MTHDQFDVISALIDGEAVDPGQLETALAQPAARALLVDFARLRQTVRQSDEDEVPGALEAMPIGRPPLWSTRVPLSVAVGIAVVAVVASLLLPRTGDSTELPPVERAVSFEPGVDWQVVE